MTEPRNDDKLSVFARLIQTQSPLMFAVSTGVLFRELTVYLTGSHIAGFTVLGITSSVIWSLIQNRSQTMAQYSEEKAEFRLRIQTLEAIIEECHRKRDIDKSKKHNLATYCKGTAHADIEFFKSLKRWKGFPAEWRADADERIAANEELCLYIDEEIPSDKLINRLFATSSDGNNTTEIERP